jgi:hypothetical protein
MVVLVGGDDEERVLRGDAVAGKAAKNFSNAAS